MIFEAVKEIIADVLSLEADSITMESNLMDDLGADSLDAVQIVMAAEDRFEITVEDEDIEKMTTVGDIVDYIQEKTQD